MGTVELFPFVCPLELLESFSPRTVDAPEVKDDKLKAGEVPLLIVSVPGQDDREIRRDMSSAGIAIHSPDPEAVEFELELAVGEGGVTGSADRPGISEPAEPAKATCLLVDGCRRDPAVTCGETRCD